VAHKPNRAAAIAQRHPFFFILFIVLFVLFFEFEGTVLFVNKKNQKNFRRMLTHPKAADGPVLGLFLGREL